MTNVQGAPVSAADAHSSPAPLRLRVDARDAGKAADRFVSLATSSTPRLSWMIPLVRDDQQQQAYEVRILASYIADESDASGSTIWASGVVESSACWVRVTEPLPSGSLAFATVRARDERGEWSNWSATVPVETGPHALDDWQAEWVSHPPLHTLRRVFWLEGSVARARLHLAAQGLVRATVNGEAVNADSSDPSRTDIVRALYRTYDVTDLLREGENTLDLDVAVGDWERSGLDPRVLAEVVADLADGSLVHAGTGEGLLAAPGEVVIQEPFYVERHDLTRGPQRFVASDRLSVLEAVEDPQSPSSPPARVEPDPAAPIHAVTTYEPSPVKIAGDVRTWDVGVNIAGRTRLTLNSPVADGTVVRIVHGEHLGADGHVDTTNLTMPYDNGRVRQAVEYVLPLSASGAPPLELEPWFCFHGFRFVEVIGLPKDAAVTLHAIALHTDLLPVSRIQTNDAQVNALIAAARRTLLNNVHGIPEDCPTREQSGWTGDTASVTEFEFSAFDMQAFFTKWIDDLLTSQQPTGWIPAIAPDIRPVKTPSDPVWGAALQRVLWGHWLHYGDAELIRRCLPALRRWTDFQLECRTHDGIIGASPISYGHDWLALQQTPPELHHTGATIDSLTVLAAFEDALGDAVAASVRGSQADELRQAARRAFVDRATGAIGNGSQASNAIALEYGWVADQDATDAADRIESDVRARGNRLSSGFAATRTVVRAMSRAGRSQAIFDALHQPAEPGIGAMLSTGNGTFWECWWIDPENTGTGSLDHVGLGGPFAAWVWQSLAGVRPIGPGFSRFVVEPQFVDGVDSLQLTTETVLGTIGVDYRRDGDDAALEVTVPVGAQAVIRLPEADEFVVGPGRHSLRGAWRTANAAAERIERVVADTEAWCPPSWAPVSADVHGQNDLLTEAVEAGAVSVAADAASCETVAGSLRCMPIPHAQLHGPLVLVRGHDVDPSAAATTPSASATFADPLDLGDASFAYAFVDLCFGNSLRPTHTVLTLRSTDGTELRQLGRIWPAGWNRVSVDVGDWAGRSSVTAISVGVEFEDESTDGVQPAETMTSSPPSFHLGEIGYSTTRRTWP